MPGSFITLIKKILIWITKTKLSTHKAHDVWLFSSLIIKIDPLFYITAGVPSLTIPNCSQTYFSISPGDFIHCPLGFALLDSSVSWVEKHWHSFSSQTENISHIFLTPVAPNLSCILHISPPLSLALKRLPSSWAGYYTVCLGEVVNSLLFLRLINLGKTLGRGERRGASKEYALRAVGLQRASGTWFV